VIVVPRPGTGLPVPPLNVRRAFVDDRWERHSVSRGESAHGLAGPAGGRARLFGGAPVFVTAPRTAQHADDAARRN
jgi:hypothetical protein